MVRKKYTNADLATVYKDMSEKGMKLSFQTNLEYALAKDQYTATPYDDFLAISIAVRDRLVERWIQTQQRYHRENLKRVYYLSMEFLIGRLLGNNIMNLGLWNATKRALEDLGFDIEEIRNCEIDAGLGNGGLGRLAACFLDSMATLSIPAHGYGIRYEYGIFNQKIVNGYQVEYPEEWLRMPNPWEFARPEYNVKVHLYGKVQSFTDDEGNYRVAWTDTTDVIATPYDIPVPGYGNDVVNTLRGWSARSSEDFDFSYFNDGDYERAVHKKVMSETISKVLYPNDNVSQGRELRLIQEYFFVAASISDILRRFKMENPDLKSLPEKAAIQLNDTHPSLAIVELMRILVDHEGLTWETAWEITTRLFAYTNHTIMPEALEKWPVPLLEKLLPRHLQIIYEINSRFLKEVMMKFPGDSDRVRRMSIVEEDTTKRIRMAMLAVVGSHSVNGVSELHSHLLKTQLFRDFYELWPKKFINVTNGITQRRWLLKANHSLANLITGSIGDRWVTDLDELVRILPLKEDASFRKKWQEIKTGNKTHLADYIKRTTGISVDPASMFDIQIKRIHEYKRQLLFAFYIISEYLKIKNKPSAKHLPRTFIVGGKSAPGYQFAKLTIKFINSIADVVNNDADIKNRLKVVFLENYRVSLAEKIMPAGDLSEQISTAGTEASGTGCMKFMVNGALTIGTLDGANIEILKEAGHENIFIFGLTAKDVKELRIRGYDPRTYIDRSPVLKEIFALIHKNFFSPNEPGIFQQILTNMIYSDYYLVCADFDSYCATQDDVGKLYLDGDSWARKSIINAAKSGKFSSDRAIRQYADHIWHVRCKK